MHRHATACLLALIAAPAPAPARADVHTVRPGESWSHLASQAAPGDVILLAPGEHRPASLAGLRGTEDAPVIIRGGSADEPATIVAGNGGLHLQRPRWVVIEGLTVVGARHNGINIDDQDGSGSIGEPWDAHLTLRRVTVRETGPTGNFDGIKLSGLRHVRLEGCTVEGWGGSAVDMVGCHDVSIAGCTFRGLEGHSQSSGVQAKGGSTRIEIASCRFDDAGQRAVNLGGSTGLEYFRPPVLGDAPPGSRWEAEDVTVRDCVFVGGDCAVAIVGARAGAVRGCTIVGTRRWPFRLLQETRDPRFGSAQGAIVTGCIIAPESMHTPVNIGPGVEPESFRWGANLWWAEGLSADRLRASLPGRVEQEQLVHDPMLDDALRPQAAIARPLGAIR